MALILNTVALMGILHVSSAIPGDPLEPGFNSTTANTTAHAQGGYFVPPPSTRGTITIIIASFSTLFTCVWTAVHLNVPSSNLGSFWVGLNRGCWLIYATFVPEYVLSRAAKQWKLSQDLRHAINEIGGKAAVGAQIVHRNSFGAIEDPCGSYASTMSQTMPPSSETVTVPLPQKKHTFTAWGPILAYFAASGGIAVNASRFTEIDFIVFTPAGLLQLARAGVLPDLSEEEIKDMSKQDGIAKLVVCLQVAWFMIQCIARPIQGLPLTLIELHVMTHILCAVAMYIIWFKKPYGVSKPYFCKDERIVNLAALFELHNPAASSRTSDCSRYRSVRAHTISLKSIQSVNGDKRKHEQHLWRANEAVKYLCSHGSHLEWKEISDGIEAGAVQFETDYVTAAILDHRVDGELFENATDGTLMSWRDNIQWLITWVAFFASSLLYTCGYALAWNFHFPTTIEMWLWRSSVIVLLASPFCIVPFAKARDMRKPPENSRSSKNSTTQLGETAKKSSKHHIITFIFDYLTGVLTSCCMFLFPFARAFILAECFASLRAPAPGTYHTVTWTNFIPHFS